MQIFGVTAINVPDLLQSLRKQGDVVTIGTETGVLESKRLVTRVVQCCLHHSVANWCAVCMQDQHSLFPEQL